MVLFLIVAAVWLISGWLGLAVVERASKSEHPNVAIIAGPVTFIVALAFWLDNIKFKPSKLRKRIRGFE